MHLKIDANKLDEVQRRTRRVRDVENLTYERSFQELGLFSLDTKRLWGEVITVFKYVKGRCEGEKNQMFSIPTKEKTGSYRPGLC